MLQQTQVNTVIPYFEAFIQAFPTVLSLAQASEDQVLHRWSGLGYYCRARNLHQAAKKIVSDFAGKLPQNLAELQSLPGIGPSTAGAILSIAFKQPATILDGNVKRVLSRLHGIRTPLNSKATENILWELAYYYTPQQRAADYTQAIMDLGATCCTRTKPLCTQCPFSKYCYGYQNNLLTEIPAKNNLKSLNLRHSSLLILQCRDAILLSKRPSPGVWGGLWSFPEISGILAQKKIIAHCRDHWNIQPTLLQALSPFKHRFTHFELMLYPFRLNCDHKPHKKLLPDPSIWYNLSKPRPIGLPKPIEKIISLLSTGS